jgi:hypothetical protein
MPRALNSQKWRFWARAEHQKGPLGVTRVRFAGGWCSDVMANGEQVSYDALLS